jgi:hypothetical protein
VILACRNQDEAKAAAGALPTVFATVERLTGVQYAFD